MADEKATQGASEKTPVTPSDQAAVPPAANHPDAALAATKTSSTVVSVKTQDAVKPSIPEKYEFKIPQGSLLDQNAVSGLEVYAKQKGLSQEDAQALVEREHHALSAYAKRQQDEFSQTVTRWADEVKADKELGGEGFKKNSELAKRVIDRFGSDSLKKALNDTGLGNHPELVRFCKRIGDAMKEDTLVIPGPQSGGNKRTLEEIFYGGGKKESGE